MKLIGLLAVLFLALLLFAAVHNPPTRDAGEAPRVGDQTAANTHAAMRPGADLEAVPRRVATRASRTRHTLAERLNWHGLAECESGNNPHAISPDGWYRGLYQFDVRTWRSVGGSGDPARASRTEQRKRAQLLFIQRGREPWPVCGRWL